MEIGIVTQEYPPETAKGGIGTQAVLKARGLTALGHRVRVISRSVDGARYVADTAEARVIRIPSCGPPIATEIADWISYATAVAAEIAAQHAERPFDLLEFSEWGCEGYVHLLNRADWNRIPSVVHLHGPLAMFIGDMGWPEPESEFARTGQAMEAAMLRLADAVYSSSAYSRDWCARAYGVDAGRIPVIHSGVDLSLFRPAPRPAGPPRIVFAGKLVRNKGVLTLVEAALAASRAAPDLRLELIGRGDEGVIAEIRRRAAAAGRPDLVEFAGFTPREALPARLARADIFAAPSLFEGGPGFVYLEAMACGLPAIACAGSGAAEVIRDGETGFLTPPGDAGALAAILRRLLGDDALRQRIGAAALDYVRREADAAVCVPRIAAFYEQVVGEARR